MLHPELLRVACQVCVLGLVLEGLVGFCAGFFVGMLSYVDEYL
ncbi:hypothetical protein TevJSym_ak00910 [endosymbiont of Tevnia jerichonana (vent Tica)]|uniref:Uncharacterized protein n=1 Tax=endosymbiont of Tevnia jerichonana (vent Tica) TaxID=1049564 RepID=G2FF79_9GAMM|nr:hypothetical protein TevJSym_ak00910 [endosymbiont of Tevnia jerichonana (vent Tica)]